MKISNTKHTIFKTQNTINYNKHTIFKTQSTINYNKHTIHNELYHTCTPQKTL